MAMVCEWFDLKTIRTVFAGLASKPVVMVSGGLASKPVATVFSSLAQNWCDGFSRFGLKTGGCFLG
jgi:hypothetical protein